MKGYTKEELKTIKAEMERDALVLGPNQFTREARVVCSHLDLISKQNWLMIEMLNEIVKGAKGE